MGLIPRVWARSCWREGRGLGGAGVGVRRARVKEGYIGHPSDSDLVELGPGEVWRESASARSYCCQAIGGAKGGDLLWVESRKGGVGGDTKRGNAGREVGRDK